MSDILGFLDFLYLLHLTSITLIRRGERTCVD